METLTAADWISNAPTAAFLLQREPLSKKKKKEKRTENMRGASRPWGPNHRPFVGEEDPDLMRSKGGKK